MPKKQDEPIVAVPVAIAKGEMGPTAQWIGCVNSDVVERDGSRYAPGTLRFGGFFGALCMKDRLYHGEYRLSLVPAQEQAAEPCDLLDVQSLPGMTRMSVAELPIVVEALLHDEEGE